LLAPLAIAKSRRKGQKGGERGEKKTATCTGCWDMGSRRRRGRRGAEKKKTKTCQKGGYRGCEQLEGKDEKQEKGERRKARRKLSGREYVFIGHKGMQKGRHRGKAKKKPRRRTSEFRQRKGTEMRGQSYARKKRIKGGKIARGSKENCGGMTQSPKERESGEGGSMLSPGRVKKWGLQRDGGIQKGKDGAACEGKRYFGGGGSLTGKAGGGGRHPRRSYRRGKREFAATQRGIQKA